MITSSSILAAKTELKAQVKIMDALSKAQPKSRENILMALFHILEAERLVPGILDQFLAGQGRQPPTAQGNEKTDPVSAGGETKEKE